MLNLSEEQKLLVDGGQRLADGYVAAGEYATADAAEVWSRLCGMGWPLVLAPEEAGGFGGAEVEALLIGRAQGQGLPDTPLISSAVTCVALLRALQEGAMASDLLEGLLEGGKTCAFAHFERSIDARPPADWVRSTLVAGGGGQDHRLDGEKICVLGGPQADGFLVTARRAEGLALVYVPADAEGVRRSDHRLVDGRAASSVSFDGVRAPAAHVLRPRPGIDPVRSAIRMTTVALVGEALGALERALEFTRQHLETRQQFGVFLAQFQVLRHKAAEIYMTVRELQALGARAARACAANDPQADDLVRAAKIYVGGAGVKAAEYAVQLHGAMGITEEIPVGRCLQRLITIDSLFGNSRQHLELSAQALETVAV